MRRAKRRLLRPARRWPWQGTPFPRFSLRPPPVRPSHPVISREARLGLFSALFLPVLALIFLWPSFGRSAAVAFPQGIDQEALLRLDPGSLSSRGGRPVGEGTPLAHAAAPAPRAQLHLHLRGTSYSLETSGATLREGLAEAGIFPKASDLLQPQPDTPLRDGMHAYLQESLPLVIYADGGIASGYTFRSTIGQALADLGIPVQAVDRVQPGLASPILGPTTVRIVRVTEETLAEEVVVEYRVLRQPNEDLEVGTQALAQEGEDGLLKRTIRVAYEDGQEISRSLDKEWMEKEAVPEIFHYGTKVVWRTLETSAGPVQYWRRMRMLATSYNASHGGKSPDHPAYGITYTGMKAGRGVVAVDPRVIPLYTRLHVPGYGLAVAGDTGGGIIGDRIDLGFEEWETGVWYTRWLDVYLLN